jgi:maltooligosyltrehalose trehalohydrolase
LYRQLLKLRHDEIVPRLEGSRFLGAEALGEAAALARWQLGDGSELRLELNLSGDDVAITPASTEARLLHNSRENAARNNPNTLPARTARMYLNDVPGEIE